MLRKLFTVSFALLISFGLYAQSGALKGKVSDIESGEPIPFANVVVELNGNLMGGGISDFDGNYTIKPIEPGNYSVKATFVGYGTIEVTGVIISANKKTEYVRLYILIIFELLYYHDTQYKSTNTY